MPAPTTPRAIAGNARFMGISSEAPIYKAIAGAEAGDRVPFRGRELLVEEVL